MKRDYQPPPPSGREGSTETLIARYLELNEANIAGIDDPAHKRRERADEMFQISEELKLRRLKGGKR
jgi:transcriptional regulator